MNNCSIWVFYVIKYWFVNISSTKWEKIIMWSIMYKINVRICLRKLVELMNIYSVISKIYKLTASCPQYLPSWLKYFSRRKFQSSE